MLRMIAMRIIEAGEKEVLRLWLDLGLAILAPLFDLEIVLSLIYDGALSG